MTYPVLCGKNRDRKGEPAPTLTPFYSKGNTWRGAHELTAPGWYVVNLTGLVGPFATKRECGQAMPIEIREGK